MSLVLGQRGLPLAAGIVGAIITLASLFLRLRATERNGSLRTTTLDDPKEPSLIG